MRPQWEHGLKHSCILAPFGEKLGNQLETNSLDSIVQLSAINFKIG